MCEFSKMDCHVAGRLAMTGENAFPVNDFFSTTVIAIQTCRDVVIHPCGAPCSLSVCGIKTDTGGLQ